MATKTTNYQMTKPAQSDYYNVDDFNGNYDIIDAAMKKLQDFKADLDENGRIPASVLPRINVVASSYDSTRAAIKLDLVNPYTGQLVTFAAPAASISVTGGLLIESNLYAIKDATGNSLLKLYKAWDAGVQLAAVLDVENKTAYMLNHNQLRKFEVLLTIPASSWQRNLSDGIAYATVAVANIDEDCFIFGDVKPSGTVGERNAQVRGWALVCEADDSIAGQLTFACYGDIPSSDLPVKVGVIP